MRIQKDLTSGENSWVHKCGHAEVGQHEEEHNCIVDGHCRWHIQAQSWTPADNKENEGLPLTLWYQQNMNWTDFTMYPHLLTNQTQELGIDCIMSISYIPVSGATYGWIYVPLTCTIALRMWIPPASLAPHPSSVNFETISATLGFSTIRYLEANYNGWELKI